jgi:adenylate cyclase
MTEAELLLDELSLPEAQLLLEVTRQLGPLPDLDSQLDVLLQLVQQATSADRATLFLNDPKSQELFSRSSVGGLRREIRVLNTSGVVGHVFQTGEALLINDPASDPRFNPEVDAQTGYVTRTIACSPLRTLSGSWIGAIELLNKNGGEPFTPQDLRLLDAITRQASLSLQHTLLQEQQEQERSREAEFMDVVSDLSGEIKLTSLLERIIGTVTRLLNAERSTLFLNDERSGELFTEIGEGLGATKIRFPNHLGIAGTVFSTGTTVNIPHAYADLRFNPSVDRQTGFFTRSILCTPLVNKQGKVIGVTQVLNKRGGVFSDDDAARLKAFTAQLAVALENAKLFDDVQTMKNYAESILESMSSGVLTVDDDNRVRTANQAACRIFRRPCNTILGLPLTDLLGEANAWLHQRVEDVRGSGKQSNLVDAELFIEGTANAANITVLPLTDVRSGPMGAMVMVDDITEEKRIKGTMARYMDPVVADELMRGGGEQLGGIESIATVLFSDIRAFTSLTESLGAQGTVGLLNQYFTLMVDCLQQEGGMLDKFIGDAIMAVFGLPTPADDDADHAVRSAIAMLRQLEVFNSQRANQGQPPVAIGIGLHTDVVVSGNIGSPKRMNYTVIGDGVNLASRLESACKFYGARLLISDSTAQRLRGTYRMREADRVVVKGKTEPVVIHELLDFHTDASFPNPMAVLNAYRDGLHLYREQRWDAAIEAFQQALKLHPSDSLSSLYLARAQQLRSHPPGPEWDGVWVMSDK